MRKYILCAFLVMLGGCGQQHPAAVVSAAPTTYSPKLQLTTQSSHVYQKMGQALVKPSWMWPAKGRVLSKFSGTSHTKGIDIWGVEGAPVLAAADGEVVYSGNALTGYGNLVIIKHQKNFLTAYAHNRKNMVKEGEKVIMGQRIAEMGKSGTDKVKLHFEIRQDGKPIDPRGLLPKK